MAGYDLIERYLEALSDRLRWQPTADDLVAEARDHLYTAAERLEARGMDGGLAVRSALDRFGDPDLIAMAVTANRRGGPAVPTSFTKTAGTAAILGGACWLALAVTWWVAALLPPVGGLDSTGSTVSYALGCLALLVAGLLTAAVTVALDQRSGGLGVRGWLGTFAVGAGAVAGLAAWVYVIWVPLMLVGTALVSSAMLARGVGPRISTLAYGGGFAAGVVTWAILRALEGTLVVYIGLWGEAWAPNLAGISVAAVIVAIGLLGLGRWLRGEAPVSRSASDGPLQA